MSSVWFTYHDIHHGAYAGHAPPSATMYHVSSALFSEHIEVIRASGHKVVSVGEFIANPASRTDTVVLTFDDGWIGAFEIGVPLLVRLGWPATFFVTSDFVGRPGFCERHALRDAASAGMEIGIHGTTHRMLSSCRRPEIMSEFRTCKVFLEDLLQRSVRHASVPGGSTNPRVTECAAELGLLSLSTSRPGVNSIVQSQYDLRRIAIRASTGPQDVRRYCRYKVGRETVRWATLQIPRKVLGMRNYARLRYWLMHTLHADVLLQP